MTEIFFLVTTKSLPLTSFFNHLIMDRAVLQEKSQNLSKKEVGTESAFYCDDLICGT